MTFGAGAYLVGCVLLAVTLGSCAAVAWLVTRAWLGHLRGSPRWLALATVWTAAVMLVHLLPGALTILSRAETWPQRPVKFIVTLGPGSGVDFGTRLLGDRLSKRWGQPVVIENRPGGDAVVAVSAVIGANDDHTLLALRRQR